MAGLNLQVIAGDYKICRLANNSPVPKQILSADWFSLTRTDDELSVVISETVLFEADAVEAGWAMLKLMGPFAFDLTGVIAGVSKVIASEEIGIFVLSTYDTDYLLVKSENLSQAIVALEANGYFVADQT